MGWVILFYILPNLPRSRPEKPKYSGRESFLAVSGFHNGSPRFVHHSRHLALRFSKGLLDRTFLHHKSPYKMSVGVPSTTVFTNTVFARPPIEPTYLDNTGSDNHSNPFHGRHSFGGPRLHLHRHSQRARGAANTRSLLPLGLRMVLD